jgi:hypothetical protein
MIAPANQADRVVEDPRIVAAKAARAEKARRIKRRRAALDSFAEFVRQAVAAGVVPGVAKLDWAPHLEQICREMQALLEGWLVAYDRSTSRQIERVDATWDRHGLDRGPEELLVQNWVGNLPPGTFKSSIVLVLANAWIWLLDPTFQFGAASGNDANVERDSVAARDIVTSSWYRTTFRVTWTIRRDADSIGKWANTKGGKRISRTVGAGFTGLHLDGLFIDDPDDADKVWNDPERLRVQKRYTRAIESRVNDERRSLRVVLAAERSPRGPRPLPARHREWSPRSARAGRGSAADGVRARTEGSARGDAVRHAGLAHEPGELLQPSRFPREVIDDKREKMGTNNYEGQYNQNSGAEDGGEVKRAWLKFWVPVGTDITSLRRRPHGCLQREDLPPRVIERDDSGRLKVDSMLLSIDCSNSVESKETSSNVGIVGYARIGEDRIVFDDRSAAMGILEMIAAVKAAIVAWRAPRVIIELKAAGATLVAELRRALARWRDPGRRGQGDHGRRRSRQGRARTPRRGAGRRWFRRGRPDTGTCSTARRGCTSAARDQGFIGEVCSFPASKKNDRVDALSQADARYRTKGKPVVASVGGVLIERKTG